MISKNEKCTQFDESTKDVQPVSNPATVERTRYIFFGSPLVGRGERRRSNDPDGAPLSLTTLSSLLRRGERGFQEATGIGSGRGTSGHTLIEVMVAAAVLAFMVVSLYAGFSSGFAVLRVARENLRATQILEERMEVLRLIKWDDVAPGFIPQNFTAPFVATDATNSVAAGFAYTGTVSIATAPLSESYAEHLKLIRIDLTWISGNIQRSRQMTSYVSKYGLQNYVYGPANPL
jgi:type II secretory pathway pseudopilin PulG